MESSAKKALEHEEYASHAKLPGSKIEPSTKLTKPKSRPPFSRFIRKHKDLSSIPHWLTLKPFMRTVLFLACHDIYSWPDDQQRLLSCCTNFGKATDPNQEYVFSLLGLIPPNDLLQK